MRPNPFGRSCLIYAPARTQRPHASNSAFLAPTLRLCRIVQGSRIDCQVPV